MRDSGDLMLGPSHSYLAHCPHYRTKLRDALYSWDGLSLFTCFADVALKFSGEDFWTRAMVDNDQAEVEGELEEVFQAYMADFTRSKGTVEKLKEKTALLRERLLESFRQSTDVNPLLSDWDSLCLMYEHDDTWNALNLTDCAEVRGAEL